MQDQATITREELATHAPAAVRALADILAGDARDADKLRAAQLILDRMGVGPHSSQEVNVVPSLVEQWAAELDALEADAGPN